MSRYGWLCLSLLLPLLAAAAPPGTLGYQARLADGSGQPITGTRNITFRLYSQPSGGVALWTETLNNVQVDGGNLAVQLGASVPLPDGIFGSQLYLGVQLQGDSEMAPRPPLSAAPYAKRAAALYRNRIEVPADGTPSENGAALLAVFASLPAATQSQPVVVQLDAGEFNLVTGRITVPSFVILSGQGSGSRLFNNGSGQTILRSSVADGAVVLLRDSASVRQLTVINSASAPVEQLPPVSAIAAYAGTDPLAPVTGIHLDEVEAIANTPSPSGATAGAYLCVTGGRIEGTRMRGFGGITTHGLRASCPAGDGLFIEQLQLEAESLNGTNVRGAELATGGPWQDLLVVIDNVSASNVSVVGILINDNNADSGASLVDAKVYIQGNGVENNSAGSTAGIWVQGADVAIIRPTVSIENLRYNGRGIRITALGTDDDYAPITDAHVNLQVGLTGGGVGSAFGVLFEGAGQQIAGAMVRVSCTGNAPCFGVVAGAATDGSVQPKVPSLSGLDVEVVSTGTTAQAGRFQEPVDVANSRFAASNGTGQARALTLSDLNNVASGRVHNLSNVRLESDTGCAVAYNTAAGETLSLRLTSSSLTGIFCFGQNLGSSTLRCAGNTRRNGDGTVDFLSNLCP